MIMSKRKNDSYVKQIKILSLGESRAQTMKYVSPRYF